MTLPTPHNVYLDTSLVAAAVLVGSPHHRAARAYCEQVAAQQRNVYFAQFLRIELLQAIRMIGTDPTALPEVMRRRNRLGKWGFDADVRHAWLAYGVAQFEQLLGEFAAVAELPWSVPAWTRSMEIMWRCQVKSYDAFHAATALEHGIFSFATVDGHFTRIDELAVELVRSV